MKDSKIVHSIKLPPYQCEFYLFEKFRLWGTVVFQVYYNGEFLLDLGCCIDKLKESGYVESEITKECLPLLSYRLTTPNNPKIIT